MLKEDLHTSATDNRFNFLQAAQEEDPLLANGPVGISQVYNGHLKGYAGRFTEPSSNGSGRCQRLHTLSRT